MKKKIENGMAPKEEIGVFILPFCNGYIVIFIMVHINIVRWFHKKFD